MGRFAEYLGILSRRWKLLVFMNLVFFGCVFAVFSASELLVPLAPYPGFAKGFPGAFFLNNFPLMLLSIFLSNLVLSALIIVSLPGFLFFPLSTAFLVFRGTIWGLLLYPQPTWVVLVAMPTFVLEGVAYALAAVGGTIVGASWAKPTWVYSEENLMRREAFERGLRECLALYVLVTILLFVAATVEALTLLTMTG